MKSKKNRILSTFIKFCVILMAFSIAQPVFSQAQKEGDVSFMGTILGISSNFQSLTFFEKTVGLSPSTVVLRENGIKLTVQDLKPGLLVNVEAANSSKGLLANRIIIQKLRRE